MREAGAERGVVQSGVDAYEVDGGGRQNVREMGLGLALVGRAPQSGAAHGLGDGALVPDPVPFRPRGVGARSASREQLRPGPPEPPAVSHPRTPSGSACAQRPAHGGNQCAVARRHATARRPKAGPAPPPEPAPPCRARSGGSGSRPGPLKSKPGSSSCSTRRNFQSIRTRTWSAACLSGRPSAYWSTDTSANAPGAMAGRPPPSEGFHESHVIESRQH